jgi:hypothetical protein
MVARSALRGCPRVSTMRVRSIADADRASGSADAGGMGQVGAALHEGVRDAADRAETEDGDLEGWRAGVRGVIARS